MKSNTLQLRKAMRAALFVLLLIVAGTMNVFAQETTLPTVITTAVTKSGSDVVSGGNVVDDGGSPVTARGICYGNNPNPDFSASFTHTEDGIGTGSYTSVISASATGTIYVRAYATNANGTAYGDELSVNVDYYRLPRFEYDGLTYVVAPDPQPSYSGYLSYSAASSYCDGLTAYGYSDWFMPDISELETMYQNRTSILGFVDGDTYHVVYYHSSTYYNSSYGHYKLSWRNGQRQLNSVLENAGSAYIDYEGSRYYIYCHVRPVRVHKVLPTVTTDNVTDITQTHAYCGGNVTNNGGAAVTAKGVCWSTSPTPTLNDNHTSDGSYNGSFTSYISNLTPGTQYYVRAYATNSEGTAYGNEVSFTTDVYSVPIVTTNSVFDITTTTAKGGGNVINIGGHSLTERGICWSTNHNPTTYNSHISDYYYYYNTGSYTLNMTGLIPGTQYYVRAYATNSEGTAYGDEVSFITTSPPTVTTNSVTNVTHNSATCGGNITNEGSGAVTARGVCWSTTPNPTTSNSHTNNGTGTGSFTSNITGLNQGTQYYIRAYATNSEGTAYGEELSFTTTYSHTVTTNNVSYITQTSASCGGYVTIYNGTMVTDRGVCWSTSNQSPTLSDSHISSGSGAGIFTSNLTGLTQNTTYYVRAYAIGSEGTAYGETKQFKTTKYEYRISEGGVVATSAGGFFYDSGGPDSYYSNNEQYTMTFMSNQGAGTTIQMTFTQFYTAYSTDYLMIYDGMNTSAPLIGTYYGQNSLLGTVTATNPDGALTFVFISNDNNTGPGWKAAISIVGQSYSYAINTSSSPSYGGTVSGGGYYDGGESCTVTAQANDGYVFTNWTENGSVVSTNASYTFTVNANRTLVANFVEMDGESCYIVFDLMDSYGDGWNGNKLNVAFSDGTPLQELTFTSGDNASFVIGVNNGVYITLSWTQGSWISECSFKVRYEVGPQIYYGSNLNNSFTYSFQMDCSSSDNTIAFADANTKALCVANWDTNGDGELSYVEAAVVTDLGEVFRYNNTITSFDELQYFTGLTSIGDNMFYGCSGLTSVNIPNSVTYFGSYAFTGCSSMTSITLPNSLTTIGNNAFFGCTGLTSIIVPSSVTYIGSEVFRDCPGLAQMSVRNGNPVYDSRSYCNAIINTATNELVYGCKNTVIPNSVISIGSAFDGCYSLTSIEIPSSVTSIGNYAFYGCGLTSMTVLTDTPPTLGYSVFYGVNESIPVYVPCNSMSAYQNAVGWNEFTNYMLASGTICDSGNISVTINPDGGGIVSGTGYYEGGATCTLTATANMGYTFMYWSENGVVVSENAVYSFMVVGDRTLVANFSSAYTITAEANPSEGGTVNMIIDKYYDFDDQQIPSGWSNDEIYPWVVTAGHDGSFCMMSSNAGNHSTISAIETTVNFAIDGMVSFDFRSDGESSTDTYDWDVSRFYVDGEQMFQYGRHMIWEYYSQPISAGMHTFKWVYKKDGSVNPSSGNDAFFVDNVCFTGIGNDSQNYLYGQTCTLAATPNEDYTFVKWTKNGAQVSTNNIYSFTVNESTTYVAHFRTQYSITASANPTAGGTISCTLSEGFEGLSGQALPEGWTTIDADGDGYNWVLGSAIGGIYLVDGASLAGSGHNQSEDMICSGSYSNATGLALTPDNYLVSSQLTLGGTLSFWACGQDAAYISEHFGVAVSTGSQINVSDFNTIAEWTMTAKSAGGVKSGIRGTRDQGTWYQYTVDLSDYAGETGYVAIRHFNCTDMFILNVDDIELITPFGNVFAYGQTCTLAATPNEDYTFVKWTKNGAQVSTNNIYSFTVNESATYVAHFISQYSITTSANPTAGGTISCTLSEGFEGLSGQALPEGWTTIDADGDGYNWALGSAIGGIYLVGGGSLAGTGHNESEDMICSGSYSNVTGLALTPDNYLVSPQLTLGGTLTFWACGQDDGYVAEHFGVAVSTGSQINVSDFNTIAEWTMTAKSAGGVKSGICGTRDQGTWYQYTVDLNDYAGQTGYVAIRHFNCTDMFIINIDDIELITPFGNVFAYGQTCILTATANEGYTFTNWTENGTVVSTDASYSFIVTGHRSLVANFTQNSSYHFVTSGNWSNAANWSEGALPGTNDAVSIDANCTLNRDAEVASLVITSGNTLTLRSGKVLTVTGTLANTTTTGLVIKDGAQFINASSNVAATMEKSISAHDGASTGWYTIASPMNDMAIAGSGFVTPEYDLYRFNETNLTSEEWENHKANFTDFTTFEKGRGYLYANNNDFTPTFTGTLNASAVTYSLTCTNRPDDPLSGFNLIGNPFPHEIYKGVGGAIDNVNLASGYYTLDNEGTWQVHTFADVIQPGQGILVKATAPTILTIAKSTDEAIAESGMAKQAMTITISGATGTDRAIVYFGQGTGLNKVEHRSATLPSISIQNEGGEYAIAHLPNDCKSLELLFNNNQPGEFTLNVSIDKAQFSYLHLIDNETGSDMDLLQQQSYSFTATGQEKANRFTLVFVK